MDRKLAQDKSLGQSMFYMGSFIMGLGKEQVKGVLKEKFDAQLYDQCTSSSMISSVEEKMHQAPVSVSVSQPEQKPKEQVKSSPPVEQVSMDFSQFF